MSIYGIDLGSFKATIATVVNHNVEIILNGSSSRSTPTYVGFVTDRRMFGDSAREKTLNFKNTVSSLVRLIGRSFHDPEIKQEQIYITTPLIDVDGEVGVQVRYLNEQRRFSATQLMAMFLTDIRRTIESQAQTPTEAKNVSEGTLVLTCPCWFQDSQRRRLLDAVQLAGWRRATLINDTSAVSFANGFQLYKSLPAPEPIGDDGSLPPPPPPKRVAFVDIGHSTFVCWIVEYNKVATYDRPKLDVKIINTVTDRHFGGRDFDNAVVEHFNKKFESKFEPGALRKSVKAQSRLFTAVNKLRTILSVNSSGLLNIECIMDEKDVSGSLNRDEFEELIQPYLQRVKGILSECLAGAQLTVDDITSVELVGGTARTASVKQMIGDFFNVKLSFTNNMEETAARGAAFYSASVSPIVKVVPSSIQDVTPYPIKFVWDRTSDLPDKDTELRVYEAGKPYPSSKVVTFYRKQDFSFAVEYAQSDKVNPVAGVRKHIAQFHVTGVKPPTNKDDFVTCKLRVKVDEHGVFSISEAFSLDENNLEEVPVDAEDEADGKSRKVKKQPKKEALTITATTQSLGEAELQVQRASEKHMEEVDINANKLDDLRNQFEETILKFGSYLSGAQSIPASDKERIQSLLSENENWHYEYEGDDIQEQILTRLSQINSEWDKWRALGPIGGDADGINS